MEDLYNNNAYFSYKSLSHLFANGISPFANDIHPSQMELFSFYVLEVL